MWFSFLLVLILCIILLSSFQCFYAVGWVMDDGRPAVTSCVSKFSSSLRFNFGGLWGSQLNIESPEKLNKSRKSSWDLLPWGFHILPSTLWPLMLCENLGRFELSPFAVVQFVYCQSPFLVCTIVNQLDWFSLYVKWQDKVNLGQNLANGECG